MVRADANAVIAVGADPPAELFQLDRTTCMVLLTTQHVGRLVLAGDEPEIIPVNYRVFDEMIIFRTGHDGRAAHQALRSAAFEVDMFDSRTRSGWSVIARGTLRAAPGDRAPAELQSWAPGLRDHWMELAVDTVTGRLLRGAPSDDTHATGGYL